MGVKPGRARPEGGLRLHFCVTLRLSALRVRAHWGPPIAEGNAAVASCALVFGPPAAPRKPRTKGQLKKEPVGKGLSAPELFFTACLRFSGFLWEFEVVRTGPRSLQSNHIARMGNFPKGTLASLPPRFIFGHFRWPRPHSKSFETAFQGPCILIVHPSYTSRL